MGVEAGMNSTLDQLDSLLKQKVISMSKIQLNLSYNVVEMRLMIRKKKVLALFSVSTLIPTVLLNSKAIDNSAIKYVLRTALGYGILLQVYAIYQDLKHINSKLLSEIESCLHDTILSHFYLKI